MKIEINIPALDRLCDIVEKMNITQFTTQTSTPAPAKIEVGEVEVVAKAAPALTPKSKAAKGEPKVKVEPHLEEPEVKEEAAPKEASAPTVDSITELAKEYVKQTSPADLRKLLDEAGIKGEKISTCDKKFYPAIEAALQAALAE